MNQSLLICRKVIELSGNPKGVPRSADNTTASNMDTPAATLVQHTRNDCPCGPAWHEHHYLKGIRANVSMRFHWCCPMGQKIRCTDNCINIQSFTTSIYVQSPLMLDRAAEYLLLDLRKLVLDWITSSPQPLAPTGNALGPTINFLRNNL
jgi:hypothetical protein